MHFTKYSIVIIDGNIVLQPPASCAEANSKFTNCGGDPTGTWKFLDYCIDPKILDALKPGTCTDWTASIDATSTQTITFAGTATSGTITTSDGNSTNVITTDFSLSCLSDGGVGSCTTLSDSKTVCTDSAAGKCHCVQTETKPAAGSTSAYPNPDPTKNGEYCVQGNILTIKDFKDSKPTGTLIVLQRQ